MASKGTNAAEAEDTREERTDGPLLDTLGATVKKMVARGKERGHVTYEELNAALPPDQVSSEQIEDTMVMLSEMGINVVESEDGDEQGDKPEAVEEAAPAGNVNEDDLGRTDDPVRMYLREMGSVELLSREGRDRHCQAHRGGPRDDDRGHLREPAHDPRHRRLARHAGRRAHAAA